MIERDVVLYALKTKRGVVTLYQFLDDAEKMKCMLKFKGHDVKVVVKKQEKYDDYELLQQKP